MAASNRATEGAPRPPDRVLARKTARWKLCNQLHGTCINYMALARGPAADFNEWARLTGDDAWKWERILPLMRDLEDFRPARPAGFERHADPDLSIHGSGGPIQVGFGDIMTPGVATFIDACKEIGIKPCLDNNSGDPVGVGLAQFNTGNGERSYAANAFLGSEKRKELPNLHITTHVSVDSIRLEGKAAVGLRLFDQKQGNSFDVTCRREIIVCQGTFGSPQLLMLSGIGPKPHLDNVGIECVQDNRNIGQKMLDHSILTIEYRVNDSAPAHNQIFLDPDALTAADALYAKDKTGPHNIFGTSGSVAFPRIDRLFQSTEFQSLSASEQAFLLDKTRPSAEIWLGSGPASYAPVQADESYITHELLLQNNLSRGTVSLTSSDPRALPRIDPRFLEHPFDKRIAIETVREAINIGKAQAYQSTIRRMVHGPDGEDDDSILEFVRKNLGQGYHSLGTCRMGPEEGADSVVDTQFRVIGLQNLRVADLSVCPVLTCNHTQINAYLIGIRCGQSLVQDFSRACQANVT